MWHARERMLVARSARFQQVSPSKILFIYFRGAARNLLQCVRHRVSPMSGSTTLHGPVPAPSRALNNEVAYMIFTCLYLEFDVCLMGLRGAAHLNGRQGTIRGPEPGSHDRWKVRLDDNKYVSVKAINLAHIRRGDYRRRSP